MGNVRVIATFTLLTALAVSLTAFQVRADESPLAMTCTDSTTTEGGATTRCSGLIPSFDGTPLDVDLTVPRGHLHDALPLLVMVSAWGSDKTFFESDTFYVRSNRDHWNTAWFVARGYAVLTYSNRGVASSCGPTVAPVGACARGWTHIADRRFELHDLKFLVGRFVDAGTADPERVGVTGFSYGGIHSMMASVEGDTVTNPDGTSAPWVSPAGVPIHLAVAVPRAGLSDIADAALPNGRASDGTTIPDGDRRQPIGIFKGLYISYLIVGASQNTRLALPGIDPSADLLSWEVGWFAGEPYDSDPLVKAFVDEQARFRAAYDQDDLIARDVATGDETPTMFVQGWTDDITPASQATALAEKMLRADPHWPIAVYLADIGHVRSNASSELWLPANAAATAFVDHYLAGNGDPPALGYTARVTECDQSVGPLYSAPTLASLARSRIKLDARGDQRVTTSAFADPVRGVNTDPVIWGEVTAYTQDRTPCITDIASMAPEGFAIWRWPVAEPFTMLGQPVVDLDVVVYGVDAEVNSRLWDLGPDGIRTLVDHGPYRYVGNGGPTIIRYALFGNGWEWKAGHTIELEITQVDAPFLRPDNLPSTILYRSAVLTLPARE